MNTEKYIHLRDQDNRPVVTICLLQHNKTITRGVAVCSPSDNPSKKTGRTIAKGRATKAMVQVNDCLPIRRTEARQVLANCGILPYTKIIYKCSADPELSGYEAKVLGLTGG